MDSQRKNLIYQVFEFWTSLKASNYTLRWPSSLHPFNVFKTAFFVTRCMTYLSYILVVFSIEFFFHALLTSIRISLWHITNSTNMAKPCNELNTQNSNWKRSLKYPMARIPNIHVTPSSVLQSNTRITLSLNSFLSDSLRISLGLFMLTIDKRNDIILPNQIMLIGRSTPM